MKIKSILGVVAVVMLFLVPGVLLAIASIP
jgi:hypothetical protein